MESKESINNDTSMGKSTDLIKPKDSVPDLCNQPQEYKVYARRWCILILFAAYSASNAMQWIQYSILYNIIMKYYDVGGEWVDWTSMIYMVLYIPLILPGSWLLDKMGLRVTALLGATLTCAGAWIKVFSVDPSLFYVTFIGQTVVALAQVCILSLPARVAAVWFGPNQVSSATSVGVFGNQLGVAVGFVVPPMLVRNHDDIELIGNDLKVMFYCVAGLTTTLVVLMILFFKDQPPTPPSAAQGAIKTDSSESFATSLKNLITNFNYMLLFISYGMNVGVFYAISTLLNPIVLQYYPGQEQDAGRIGLCIVLAGMLGSVVCGFILDKTHRFKETTFSAYAFSTVGMWVFAFTLDTGSIFVVYVTASLLGFFMTGLLPVGFEFAAELTYPEPEGTSAGLLNAAAQVFGILFTNLASQLLQTYGDIPANVTMAVMLCIGTVCTALIKSDLRRQNAQVVSVNNLNP